MRLDNFTLRYGSGADEYAFHVYDPSKETNALLLHGYALHQRRQAASLTVRWYWALGESLFWNLFLNRLERLHRRGTAVIAIRNQDWSWSRLSKHGVRSLIRFLECRAVHVHIPEAGDSIPYVP